MKRFSLAVFMTLALATGLAAEEPKELAATKKEFEQNAHPDEAARARYILTLAKLRDELARGNGNWKAVDEELRKHPVSKDADAKALTAFRVGQWNSTRHEMLYRKDGTWTMTPIEPGITHGTWKIIGNQYIDTSIATGGPPTTGSYTIILLTAKDFIFTDGEVVFFEKKKGK